MSDVLLGTNMVSILAPMSAGAAVDLLDWLNRMDDDGRFYSVSQNDGSA